MPELRHPDLPPEQTIHVSDRAAERHYLPAGWLPADEPAEPAPSEPDDAGLDLSHEGDRP